MRALVIGRFHAVTKTQSEWLASLANQPVEEIVCALTSADHQRTRRNPLDLATRERLVRPALQRSGKPFSIVRLNDIEDNEAWVAHVMREVGLQTGRQLEPAGTQVLSANQEVIALFAREGFQVAAPSVQGLTPQELVQRIVDGQPWQSEASPETVEIFSKPELQATLRGLFGERLLTSDGELGHQRDFASYGAQMDASLKQKLDDFGPWIQAGSIVDKGCGTGKLLVELARRYPTSRLVGVDLSREFLRLCDQNTYASQDVGFVFGNVIDQNVPDGMASTIIFSSVMHEVHSYTGYRREEIDRALSNARRELAPRGVIIVRDGVSPEPALWRLRFLKPDVSAVFDRFAREFKHGQGARFERLSENEVQLSAHDANEFLCKKDYQKNWHIEVHEEFGPLTCREWGRAFERAGLQTVHLEEKVNPWIVQNRYEGTVTLHDANGQPVNWPATSVVAVARRSS